ncbi:DUF6390 family protein [Actinoplanes sp. CA-030573]|uniref:DUF6390 family protein n=1 Tax=Actinoplanes sp. CA-030573 TaxID=3239898 RepID=UPI003D9369F2
MSDAGALLFARYAYPPNELGYCGPSGASDLLRSELASAIAARAPGFDGAWAYLSYLAADDPLAVDVVEAYWVGNSLLDAGDFSDLSAFLGSRFAGQRGGTWADAGARALPHHSFHVFEVYPWAALLRRTGNPTAVSVLDRCRIRTGKVVTVSGEQATVLSHPLVWDGSALAAGPPRPETVSWSAEGRSLLAGLAPGDLVSLHWDWVCDVITPEQAARIESLEERALQNCRTPGLPSPP